MTSMTKWIGLGVLIVAFVFVAACERTITRVEETTTPESCFSCHSDASTFLVAAEAQWENSKHASGDNIDRNTILFGTPCVGCHTSEGFVARVTTGQIPAVVENPTAIHCFTCHAPHTNENLSLRVTEVQKLKNGESFDLHDANICTACHQALNNVNTYVAKDVQTLSQYWGPHHGVQSDMLIGTNGYEYAGFEYSRTNHRGGTDNGCLDCHFKTTRNYILGGHSFNMAFDREGTEEFNTAACAQVQCHPDEELTDFNRDNVQSDVTALIDQLQTLLINANLLAFYADDNAYEPTERGVHSATAPGDSAGAVWNYLLAREDRSEGVHNREYITGLLESSIQFMQPAPPLPSVAAGGDKKTAH
jgi:hypothetical protein